ncbi:probable cyclin-dependent serine/threonine-protein kinase DDB_G0292550 isoform X3 [Diabrotica virgifera virgifera]|uniref:Uncharacterized protein n=1 Tax=Diabrotica virgifera virgifera TaxID=50390 RepID=A0ABM5JPR5_DIAVI|nr:probable cyclin-dependent serine/threonine-protein kinase DDB_G0292550 isoform X3 [Diabrotica virgifera virgifera]
MEALNNNHIMLILNKIKSRVNETYHQKWTAEAGAECYQKETEKLDFKIEYLNNDIARIEEDIKEITPQIGTLEEQYKILMDTYSISQQSYTFQKSHIECITEKAKMRKEEGDNILRKYTQHLESRTKHLQETNPTFKILRELQVELKKEQFNIKMLQFTRKQQILVEETKYKIQQKMYYQDFIVFAKAWLEKKYFDESTKKLQEVSSREKELMKKLLKLDADIKEKQKYRHVKKVDQRQEESQIALKTKLIAEAPLKSKNDNCFSKRSENLNNLFLKPNYISSLPSAKQTQNVTKLNILENKVIRPRNVETTLGNENKNKEEKNMALSKKLQQVVQNVQNMKERQASFKENKLRKRFCSKQSFKTDGKNEENGNNNGARGAFVPTVPLSAIQNVNRDIRPSQESVTTITLSQDHDALNLLSQESGTNTQTKLREFRYDSDMAHQRLNTNQQKRFPERTENLPAIPENTCNKNELHQYVPGTDGSNCRTIETRLGNQFEKYNMFMANNNKSEYFSRNNIIDADKNGFDKNLPSSSQASSKGSLKNPDNEKSSIFENKFGIQPDKITQNSSNINNSNLFSSNTNKGNNMEGDNHKFHMPFSMVQSDMNPNKQYAQQQYHFEENLNNSRHNTFKKQKLEVENVADNSLLNISLDMNNYGAEFSQQNRDESKMLELNGSQYNFGNITGFMPSPMGDFPMSPEFNTSVLKDQNQKGSEMTFSGQGFAFSQMDNTFGFKF